MYHSQLEERINVYILSLECHLYFPNITGQGSGYLAIINTEFCHIPEELQGWNLHQNHTACT